MTSACGRYIFRPYLTLREYPRMYRDIDIGIIPNVYGDPFQDAKSDIKGLEMAGMGVPCVASPLPAYREWRDKPGTGAVVLPDNSTGTWLEALRPLIENEHRRRDMAQDALRFAQTRSIERWAPKWLEAYQEAGRRRGSAR